MAETVQYIEDPEVAALVADLKRRWPAIGDAADHPLTEWFIHKYKRMKTGRYTAMLYGLLLLSVAVPVVMIWVLSKVHSLVGILSVVVAINAGLFILLRIMKKPRRRKDLISPYLFFSGIGDRDQWAHMWLAPLTTRDLLGICVGWVMFIPKLKRSRPLGAKILHWSLFALALAVALMALLHFGGTRQGALSFVCLLPFLYTFFAVWKHPATRANQAIMLARNTLNHRYGRRVRFRFSFSMSNLLTYAFFFCVAIGAIFFFRSMPFAWHALQVMLIAWSVIFGICSLVLQRRDPTPLFNRLLERECREFEADLDKLIGRE